MRITIMALGSRGDVQPYVALGGALRAAGHLVTVATFENFEPLVRGQGLAFNPVRGNAQTIMAGSGGVAIAESGQNTLKLFLGTMRSFGSMAEDYIEAFSTEAMLESEVIINQLPAGLFGYDLAEKLGVPYFTAAVIPLHPTRSWPLPLMPSLLPGGVYNRFTYSLGFQMGWQMFRRAINRYRARLGLPPAPWWGMAGDMQRAPVLNGFSPHVVPPPPDWRAHVHTTGYWLLPEAGWTPPQALLDFLDAGPPPVFIGFGSMPVRDPKALTELVLAATRKAGVRLILHAGWAGLADTQLPDDVFQLDYAPYTWLFPRMAAIAHHGGSGTTGLALRSGAPSLVVAFGADQFYWGQRVAALGAGLPPISRKALTAETLAHALRVMTTHDPMRQRAAEVGARLRAEDGLGTAVRIIESEIGRASPKMAYDRD